MGIRAGLFDRARATAVRALTENVGLKALSLGLAVTLWAWVQADRVVELRTRAVVQYKMPEKLVPVDELRKTLVVTVSGPQGLVRTMKRNLLTVPVDLSEAEEGTLAVDFTERSIAGLPAGVQVVQVSPPAADIQLDRRMTRTVRVKPTVIGDPDDGWQKTGVAVEPDEIEITGPRSLVREIAEVTTDVVDISGAQETRRAEVRLAIKERTVRPVEERPLTVTVNVEAIVSTRAFTQVPVLSQSSDWKPAIDLVRVTLKGPVTVLGALKPERVHVVVDPPAEGGGAALVAWQPESAENPVRVVHQGPPDLIEVTRVEPSRIPLEPIR